jgi:SSS family solute:Na+ symporter
VVCTGVGLWFIELTKVFNNVLDVWWALAGIFSGGILGLFLLGALSRRATSRIAAIAVTIGLIVIVWAAFSPVDVLWPDAWNAYRNPLHNNLTVVLGTFLILAIGLAGSFLSGPAQERSRRA